MTQGVMKQIIIKKNFNKIGHKFYYKRIQSLYSNLSSLNFLQLYELREK